MTQKQRYKIIVIVGPTASGKSELGVRIAHKFNGEIISADSRQVYRGLDAGSGKVRGGWQKINKSKYFIYKSVLHHCIDIADPKKIFTAADFVECGRRAIADILSRCKTPIIVGGTGFYINSLIYNYSLPSTPQNLKFRAKLEEKPISELFTMLKKLDPERAKNIDRQNPRRLIRALEIILSSKKPVPSLKKESNYEILKIGLKINKKKLRENIENRLKKDLRRGIITESARLHKKGLSWKRMEELGLEYRLLAKFLQNFISKKELKEKLKTEIWRYAKRQLTWFKKEKDIFWISSKPAACRLVKNFLC